MLKCFGQKYNFIPIQGKSDHPAFSKNDNLNRTGDLIT